ncbi:DUF2690 domain-containing protein [Anaerolinea thermophila]|nr:DUF2690 domain-containing protein [Anaerolinea thermophila]
MSTLVSLFADSRKVRLVVFALMLVLFILGAGAPEDAGGVFQKGYKSVSHSHFTNILSDPEINTGAQGVNCSGSACNNTDPGTTGCNVDAATIHRKVFTNTKVQLRFSDTCQTRWSKTINKASINFYGNATLRYYYYGAVYLGPGYSVYSNQRFGMGYQACGKVGASPMNYLINDTDKCTAVY